jgi:1,2-diacylglycerol 3-alpha-glucosyltransferase
MRIGMMADTYKPHVSGITNYISLNKRFLEQQGHDVFVFTFGDEIYQDDEVNIIRSPGLPLIDTGYYLGLRYDRNARRMLYSMDLVHVHHPFLSGSLALHYCRPRNIPIVFTNHTRYDLYTQAYLPMLPESVGEAAMKAYLPPFCRACDLVISPSPGMADVLHRFGVDAHIEVVPNGVELEPFYTSASPLQRSDFSLTPEQILLIYVGRLAPEKNLPFLLRAFDGLAEAYSYVHLLLVGSGPEQENLESQVKLMRNGERVHFFGQIPYDQLPRILAMADAFVTASVTEVHPLSVIEAMAASLPVLGITSPGVGDTVRDGETGYLTPDDLAAFTAKMARLVSEPENLQRMSKQALLASKTYDIHLTSKIMLQHYQHLCDLHINHKRSLRHRVNRFFDRWQ